MQNPGRFMGDVGDHLLGVGEIAAVAGLDCERRDRRGEMCFAAAGLTEEQDRPAGFHEPQRRQVVDELAVHGWLEREVELVDGLAEREPGVTQPCAETAVAGRVCLLCNESRQELDVRHVVRARLLGEDCEHFGGTVELQVAEVVFDLFVDAGAHPRSPPSTRTSSLS